MKVFLRGAAAVLFCIAAACTTTPSGPAGAAPAPTPSAETAKQKQAKDTQTLLDALSPKAPPIGDEDENDRSVELKPFIDPATKLRLQKVRKEPPYFEKDGHLFNGIVHDDTGVPIVRQDATFYYIESPPEGVPEDPRRKHEEEVNRSHHRNAHRRGREGRATCFEGEDPFRGRSRRWD